MGGRVGEMREVRGGREEEGRRRKRRREGRGGEKKRKDRGKEVGTNLLMVLNFI